MENNLDNKAKYFAQYWGQDCLTAGNANTDNLLENWGEDVIFKTQYLVLKPLSSITDEDAANLSEMFNVTIGTHFLDDYKSFQEYKKSFVPFNYCHEIAYFDYLRSKGYALPFMGLSVEQLIEYGWLKIATS